MESKNNRIIPFLAIIAIAIALPVTTYIMVNRDFELRISAFQSDEPHDVVITDIQDDSFRVSWVTQKDVIGGLRLSNDPDSPLFEGGRGKYHSIEVKNLDKGMTYSFKLLSNDVEWDDNGSNYSATTAPITTVQDSFLIYGQVFSPDGITFQQGGVIVLEFENGDLTSQKVSRTLNEAGGYQLDIGGLLEESLNNSFPYRGDINVQATVYTTDSEEPVTKKYTVNLTATRELPNIYLGDASVEVIPGVNGL